MSSRSPPCCSLTWFISARMPAYSLVTSYIAAAALTVLPELLRAFSDYRMLVYAIVLILVMLATNNPTLKTFFGRFKIGKRTEKEVA